MKKIVFALQVFALIAVLPVYVALEMNHEKKPMASTETETTVAYNTETSFSDFGSSVERYPLAAMAFNQVSLKTKKKCSNSACSCQNCKCGASCTCKDF